MSELFKQLKYSKIHAYPLNWLAIYRDGSMLKEFENEYVKNDFNTIDQKKIKYFGLYGKGNEIYFNNKGQWFYNTKKLNVFYEAEGVMYKLTDNEFDRDLITYKQAYVEYDKENGTKESATENVSVGYKQRYLKDDLVINSQLIITTPLSPRVLPYMQIKLSSNKNLDGKLVFYGEQGIVDEIEAPLAEGFAGQLNWTIKL